MKNLIELFNIVTLTIIQQLKNKAITQEKLNTIILSKDNFLKLRFQNKDKEYQEYILSKFKGKNGDFTQKVNSNLESENVDDMKYSISFRSKENRYMGRFTINGKREYAYGRTPSECLNNLRKKKKELQELYINDSNKSKNLLNSWFNYWVNNIYKPKVKESTYKQTLELYNRHAKK